MRKLILLWNASDKYLVLPVVFTIIACLVIIIPFIIIYNNLPPRLPLFYSLEWGQNQLIAKPQFLILPAIMVLTSLVNILITTQLHHSQVVIKRILMLNIVLVNFLILMTAYKVLSIFV